MAAIVQQATGGLGALTATFPAPIAAGNTVVVFTRAIAAISAVSDGSTSYALAVSRATNNNDPLLTAYVAVPATSGATTITVTGALGGSAYVYAIEISGLGPTSVATTGSNNGNSTTALTGGVLTTTRAALILAYGSQEDFATYTAGASFTLQNGNINGAGGVEYYDAPAVTAFATGLTSSSGAPFVMISLALIVANTGDALLMGCG